MNPVRTVIVDDHVMLRDGIVSILQKQSDFEVVGEAGTVADAVEVVQAVMPDLVLMDYSLPDGNGLEATREILAANPKTRVVLLTMYNEDDLLFAAVRGGAKGYLLKDISAKDMLESLRRLADGDVAMLPAEKNRILSEFARIAPQPMEEQEDIPSLTDRELEVLELVAAGLTNQEIALQLHISPHTVKNHVHNTLDKLQAADRHEAAKVAIERKLIKSGRY